MSASESDLLAIIKRVKDPAARASLTGKVFPHMRLLHIDLETASTLDLRKVGASAYSRHPDTLVTVIAWAFDDGPVSSVTMPKYLPYDVSQHLASGGGFVAWNAAFEWAFLTNWFGMKQMKPEQAVCSMQRALYSGLPAKLEHAGPALGLPPHLLKDVAGHRLMMQMCRPKQDGTFWHDVDPGKLKALEAYCKQDVIAERAVCKLTPELPDYEKAVSRLDRIANDKGIKLDIPLIHTLIGIAKEETAKLDAECKALTGGNVTSPGTQTQRLLSWLWGEGIKMATVGKDEVQDTLDTAPEAGLSPLGTKVLAIRQKVAKSSVKKLQSMLNTVDTDGRVRGTLQYYGAARTGRFCVAGGTLVDTPEGPRRIIGLRPGDIVIGGSGQPRKVLAKFYKGIETMYRLEGPDGAFVEATLAHRIMTETGWRRIDECFEEDAGGRFVLRGGRTPLSVAGHHDGGSRGEVGNDAAQRGGGAESPAVSGGIQAPEERGILSQPSRGEEPQLWHTERGETGFAQWSNGDVERRWLHLRTPERDGDGAGTEGAAGGLARPPYRRRQDERHLGQSGSGDAERASGAAQAEAWSLAPVGERGVWDISVEGDASYVAQGLIHHNSGRLIQPQNFPRPPKGWNPLDAINAILGGLRNDGIGVFYGEPLAVVSACLRGCLIPSDGKQFLVFDLSQIEARVLAWLAGQNDVLEVFRKGEDVYSYTSERLGLGSRQAGKVAVLGLGFGMGHEAFVDFALANNLRLNKMESLEIVTAWRDANSFIRQFWWDLDAAAKQAISFPGSVPVVRGISLLVAKSHGYPCLLIKLPSRRYLWYRNARLVVDPVQPNHTAIQFDGVDQYTKQWQPIRTWGSKLAENVTQAVARDIIVEAALRVSQTVPGTDLVLSVHDELLFESDYRFDAKAIKDVVEHQPAWAKGLPIASEGGSMRRYGKL